MFKRMSQQKNNLLKTKLKNVFIEWLKSSTCHGYSNILKARCFFVKIIWILFSVVSTGLCAYMVRQNIINFMENEVVTKTRIINNYIADFPTITICNMNFFTTDFSINFTRGYLDSLSESPFSSLYEYYYKNNAKNFEEYDNLKNLFGDSLDKLIIDCYFDYLPCNRTEFRLFSHPIHGNCYQFNSGFDFNETSLKLKTITNDQRSGGLRLILNISVPDSLRLLNPNSGGYIFIHNQTNLPMMVDPLTFSPKTETNIALYRTFYQLTEKPYSNCQKENNFDSFLKSKGYKFDNNYQNEYTQLLCFSSCFQNLLIENCGCQEIYFPTFQGFALCINESQYYCIDRYFVDVEYARFCFEECPLECSGMWFDKTVSTNHISILKYQELFKRYVKEQQIINVNANDSFDEIAIINIYYRKLGYTQINESPKIIFVDLLSSIGGIGGLFLGISVLTLVEVLELIFLIICEIKKHNRINISNN